ncbi:hypothetical protein DL765_010936 [Monosporascus sp. GIB2]|nr:hypothetical protein DL765_010936 [Monosporascus sp. GIB2]
MMSSLTEVHCVFSAAESVSETVAEEPQPKAHSLSDEGLVEQPCLQQSSPPEGGKDSALSIAKHKTTVNVDVDLLEGKAAEECRVPLYSMSVSGPGTSLTVESRKIVCASFLFHNWGGEKFDVSAIELSVFAEAHVNGRVTNNLVKNALVMNVEKGGKVGFGTSWGWWIYVSKH